jgi:RimJ/RimL family protein N-acetyltransferase
VANIDAQNVASIALIERLGFQREGWLREHETTHEGLRDLLVYGLLRDEWAPPAARERST